MSRTRTKKDPGQIAATLANEKLAELTADPSDFIDTEGFNALLDAILANYDTGVMTLKQEVAAQERIRKCFDNREDEAVFMALCDWHNLDALTQCHAGFVLGLEFGRRIGGTR